MFETVYCGFCNIREVLIFATFARRANLRVQQPREYYFYNSATEEKEKNRKFAKN